MYCSVIIDRLKEKINKVIKAMPDKSIIVLKGVPFSFVEQNENVCYADIIENKLGYLL